jgi:hypothetical protein
VEFQNGDWVESSLFVILNVSHIEEVAAYNNSGSNAFEQGIAALENFELLDGAKIARQGEAHHSRRHEGVLNCDQLAAVKVEPVNGCEAQVTGMLDRGCNVGLQVHDDNAIGERRDIQQAVVRRKGNSICEFESLGEPGQIGGAVR